MPSTQQLKVPQCTALQYKTMIQDLWARNDKVLVVINGFHEALMRQALFDHFLYGRQLQGLLVCLAQNLFQKFTMI